MNELKIFLDYNFNFCVILIICIIAWVLLFRKILKIYDVSFNVFFKDFFKFVVNRFR